MQRTLVHNIYLWTMALITIAITLYLSYVGMSYYRTPLEERFYHPQYDWFKASGAFGHGLGIVGTLLIVIGVVLYIGAKQRGWLTKHIRLRYLLEFHIFLCTLGPIMVLFHTTFKFGGLVSVGFWSMVLVVLSGVVGRYIYLQIPRAINGRELALDEVESQEQDLVSAMLKADPRAASVVPLLRSFENPHRFGLRRWLADRKHQTAVRQTLVSTGIDAQQRRQIAALLKDAATLRSRMARLETMQSLFKYWHVAHRPFALIMLVIVVLHVAVTLLMGYRWVF
jgi:hypothetical protein